MTDLTSSESVPPWYKDFVDVFRDGFAIPAKGSRLRRLLPSGKDRSRPIYYRSGRAAARQGWLQNWVQPLNALPRNPTAGIMPEPLAYVLEQILR